MAARRPSRFYGHITPDDLRHHDRKMIAQRRAEGVNDRSLEVVARRLAEAFPQEIDPEPYRKVIRDWLDRGENARRRNLSKLGKKALSHQKAIALLHGVLDGKLPSAEDTRWLKERFSEKDAKLTDSIDALCACAATTSAHLTNSDESTCYTICRVGDVDIVRPLIGRAVLTQPIRQIIAPRDPERRKAFFESFRPLLGKQLFDSTFAHPQGLEPHEQYGSKSVGFSGRVEPVFLPGNETVTLDGSDDYIGVHSLSRDGKWTVDIADSGDPGLQRRGADELRVGPRTLVEARKLTNSKSTRPRRRRSALPRATAFHARAHPSWHGALPMSKGVIRNFHIDSLRRPSCRDEGTTANLSKCEGMSDGGSVVGINGWDHPGSHNGSQLLIPSRSYDRGTARHESRGRRRR